MKKFTFLTLFISLSSICFAQTKLLPVSDGYIYLDGTNVDSNFGNETQLRTRYAKENEFTRQTYIRFDLSEEVGAFSSVQFYIYGKANSSKLVDVYSAFGEWTDTSLKGSVGAKPSRQTYIGTFKVQTTNQYYSVDLTEYINQIKLEGKTEVSLVLADRIQQVATDEAYYHSKENVSGNMPYLLLEEGTGSVDLTPKIYYVDANEGNDDADGLSSTTPWKSLAKVESTFLNQGDQVLLKKGSIFKESLYLKVIPQNTTSITKLSTYGEGENPIIDAEGKESFDLMIFNTPYIEVSNLTFTHSNVDPASTTTTSYIMRGLYYQAEDMGEVKHLELRNLIFRDILGNSGSNDGNLFAKRSAGLSVEITGNNTPTYLNGYLLENSSFYRVGRHGAVNQSTWFRRTLTENTNWVPSKNFVIRNNVFEETASDGLIVRIAEAPLMEYNFFKRCAITLSGNACFSYNCDNALWQYNESCYTVYNTGDYDGGGFDSDYMSKNAVFQYNYSHHNEKGDMLVTGGARSEKGFNDGTIVRYNVFYNNGHQGIRVSGLASNTKIYNNIIYKDNNILSPTEPYDEYAENRLFYHRDIGGLPSNTYYANNIYYYYHDTMSATTDIAPDKSPGSEFFNNIIYANKMSSYPDQTDGITEDPLIDFDSSISNWEGLDKMLNFRLQENSPAINSGIEMPNSLSSDYAGTTLPQGGVTDIGAFEYPQATVSITEDKDAKSRINILSNPVTDGVLAFTFHSEDKGINLQIFSFSGKLVQNIDVTPVTNNTYHINVTPLKQGAYVLKVNDKANSSSGIFFIAK